MDSIYLPKASLLRIQLVILVAYTTTRGIKEHYFFIQISVQIIEEERRKMKMKRELSTESPYSFNYYIIRKLNLF